MRARWDDRRLFARPPLAGMAAGGPHPAGLRPATFSRREKEVRFLGEG